MREERPSFMNDFSSLREFNIIVQVRCSMDKELWGLLEREVILTLRN